MLPDVVAPEGPSVRAAFLLRQCLLEFNFITFGPCFGRQLGHISWGNEF